MRKSKKQRLVTQSNTSRIANNTANVPIQLSLSLSFLATAIEVDCDLQNKFASITINCVFAVCFGRFIRLWFVSFHFIPSFSFAKFFFYLYYHFLSKLSTAHDCGWFKLHHLHLHLNCRFIGPSVFLGNDQSSYLKKKKLNKEKE